MYERGVITTLLDVFDLVLRNPFVPELSHGVGHPGVVGIVHHFTLRISIVVTEGRNDTRRYHQGGGRRTCSL